MSIKYKILMRDRAYDKIISQGKFTLSSPLDIPLDVTEKFRLICKNCGESVKMNRKQAFNKTCPLCGYFESSNEHLIDKILTENNIVFDREHLIRTKKGNQLLDFYIPKYNIAIEHQGDQHYNENNGLYSQYVLDRDRFKFASCLSMGIGLAYTYENNGLLFDQLTEILKPYGVKLKRIFGSKYPPAQRLFDLIINNPDNTISWYLKKANIGNKTFQRYLKMCGFVGLNEVLLYNRWKDIPDDEFLNYLAHNGLRKAATHYDKTVKTITTHLNDLGYSNLYNLQIERKTIIDAYDNKLILDLIISERGLKGASEQLGFPKYILEHYLPKLGYKNYKDVCKNYIPML